MQFLDIFLQLRWKPKRLTASSVTLLWRHLRSGTTIIRLVGVKKRPGLEKVRTSVRIDMREGLDLNLPYAVRSNLQSLAGADIGEIKKAVE